jgi:hypothetical protein
MQGGGEVRGCGSSARRMVYVGVSAGVVSTAVIGYFSDPSRMALVAEGMGMRGGDAVGWRRHLRGLDGRNFVRSG